MKSGLLAIALLLAIAAAPKGGQAAEPKALQLSPKAALVTAAPSHRSAPFVIPASEPELDFLPHRDERVEQSRSSCESNRSLCYDAGSGRIVYKPARALMPELPGLQRENISVKRDKLVLKYSF
jgi:hypothetical protein